MAVIACLQTAETNLAVFDEALHALCLKSVALRHSDRADLLAAAELAGSLTARIGEDR